MALKLSILSLLLLSGCAMLDCNDTNEYWPEIRDCPKHEFYSPEDRCLINGGRSVLKGGEFYFCDYM